MLSILPRSRARHSTSLINHSREVKLDSSAISISVGIGSDFDGIGETPAGLEDVSKYPALVGILMNVSSWYSLNFVTLPDC